MSFDFDIKKIAHLARIAVTAEEEQQLRPRLESVMAMVDELQQIDTTGIEPMASPLDLYQRLRDDVVTEKDEHEVYQALAPKVAADLYLVPQVIE